MIRCALSLAWRGSAVKTHVQLAYQSSPQVSIVINNIKINAPMRIYIYRSLVIFKYYWDFLLCD